MNAAEAEPAERLRELLTRAVDAFGVSGSVEVHEDDEWLKATVHGEDLGLLIGRHGETIDALQHLGFRIAYRDTDGRWDELRQERGVFKGFAPLDETLRAIVELYA